VESLCFVFSTRQASDSGLEFGFAARLCLAPAAVPATAGATTKSAELSKIEERVRQRQSMLLEQTNELQQLEKRLAAAEERKRQLESRGGFI
jgi:septal ring factor EnvC (AmiA/AmiB activator)